METEAEVEPLLAQEGELRIRDPAALPGDQSLTEAENVGKGIREHVGAIACGGEAHPKLPDGEAVPFLGEELEVGGQGLRPLTMDPKGQVLFFEGGTDFGNLGGAPWTLPEKGLLHEAGDVPDKGGPKRFFMKLRRGGDDEGVQVLVLTEG